MVSVPLPDDTPAAKLRARIRREGSIPFRDFMDTALYDPQHGYYRRPRDPFGAAGDYFTAEQVQPVFGILIAAAVRTLWREMGEPSDFTVVELGAGRGEMAPAFAEWRYVPVEAGSPALPDCFRGVVFSNEFFDALPVEAAVFREGAFRQMRVGLDGERFVWVEGGAAPPEVEDFLRRYFPPPEEGRLYEANLAALDWLRRVSAALESGFVLTLDYGYTRAESIRFPRGTLMAYRRHTAHEDVLADPGGQDITAHVPFTALEEYGSLCGLERVRFENMAATLLAAGEADQFAAALAAASPREELDRRMKLKTLLFGMGETFRTLLQRKATK